MWPWEHLAVGYLAYSLYVHVSERRPPGSGPVVAVAVGTQFPDLVDKPLAWSLGVLPTGHALAHSLLVAVPASVLAVAAARHLGRDRYGTAFAVGYLSHLPGDVLYPVAVGNEPNLGFLLWPLVSAPSTGPPPGFLETVLVLLGRYRAAVLGPSELLALELGLLGAVFVVWLSDGAPPLGSLVSAGRSAEESP